MLDLQGQIKERGTKKRLESQSESIAKLSAEHRVETITTGGDRQEDCSSTATDEASEVYDPTRRNGDLSLYIYYAKSVGWIWSSVFLFAMVTVIFGLDFSSVWQRW